METKIVKLIHEIRKLKNLIELKTKIDFESDKSDEIKKIEGNYKMLFAKTQEQYIKFCNNEISKEKYEEFEKEQKVVEKLEKIKYEMEKYLLENTKKEIDPKFIKIAIVDENGNLRNILEEEYLFNVQCWCDEIQKCQYEIKINGKSVNNKTYSLYGKQYKESENLQSLINYSINGLNNAVKKGKLFIYNQCSQKNIENVEVEKIIDEYLKLVFEIMKKNEINVEIMKSIGK